MSKLDLQIFAEEAEAAGATAADEAAETTQEEPQAQAESGEAKEEAKRTYDDAEVDRIVAKHKKEWEKEAEKKIEEAKEQARKYERMTKEQREEADKKKAEEDAKKKDERIMELEQQIARDALRKSVANDVEAMPEGIAASQDFLDLVVTGDADDAKKNVSKLVGIILADRKAQEEKRAVGRTPKTYTNTGNAMTEIEKRLAKYKKK